MNARLMFTITLPIVLAACSSASDPTTPDDAGSDVASDSIGATHDTGVVDAGDPCYRLTPGGGDDMACAGMEVGIPTPHAWNCLHGGQVGLPAVGCSQMGAGNPNVGPVEYCCP